MVSDIDARGGRELDFSLTWPWNGDDLSSCGDGSMPETSLHRDLKRLYGDDQHAARHEVHWGDFRIDVVTADELVEIQLGSLAAIRDKVARLLKSHRVRVVKPIVIQKQLITCPARGSAVTGRRRSPKRRTIWELFHELVYFVCVFPHPRLTLEVPLIEIEERRHPGHGRRRRWRARDYQVEDQKLLAVRGVHRFQTAADLAALAPDGLPAPFHSGDLAAALAIDRFVAQRVAYCLLHCGAARHVGKKGNARLYELSARDSRQPVRSEMGLTSEGVSG